MAHSLVLSAPRRVGRSVIDLFLWGLARTGESGRSHPAMREPEAVRGDAVPQLTGSVPAKPASPAAARLPPRKTFSVSARPHRASIQGFRGVAANWQQESQNPQGLSLDWQRVNRSHLPALFAGASAPGATLEKRARR